MSIFVPFDTQYSPHTSVSIHPRTGVLTITVAFHPNNRGGYNCKIWELAPPYTEQPHEVKNYVQGQAGVSVGPFGHGASIPLPTGGVLTVVPVAGDAQDNVRPSILIDHSLGAPYSLDPGGGGSITLFDAPLTSPSWSARVFKGAELVDIPAVFGAPLASAYLLRLAATASGPNVRLRAGSPNGPFILTVNTQVAGVEIQGQGWAPGPLCYISTVGGTATCYVQVIGHS